MTSENNGMYMPVAPAYGGYGSNGMFGGDGAQILANNEAQTAALEQYLAPVARPAYIVQNPNCCGQFGYGYGGCGNYSA